MPAPALAASAVATLATSKWVRRLLLAAGGLLVVVLLAVISMVMALPLAAAAGANGGGEASPVDNDGALVVDGEWTSPMSGGYYKGRGFGYNPVFLPSGALCSFCSVNHQGYDMSQGCGSTIYAAAAGTVTVAGGSGGYGNAVYIDHGGGIQTIYGHMEWGRLSVAPGDVVAAGEPLGTEGNTGNSVGCHLHFEIRVDGYAVPPEDFLARQGIHLQ